LDVYDPNQLLLMRQEKRSSSENCPSVIGVKSRVQMPLKLDASNIEKSHQAYY